VLNGTPLRVALFAPSPIPYKVPLFRRIAAADGIDLSVMYACSMGVRPATAGYSHDVVWDAPLLEGYRADFLKAAHRNAPVAASPTELVNPEIIRWLRRGSFDVLWSDGYSWITHQLGIITQRIRGAGVVLRDEATLLQPRGFMKTVLKEAVVRSLFRVIDAAVYISSENRRWLEHFGLGSERLFSSPYCPDTDYFNSEAARLRPQRPELRRSFGLSPDSGPVILSVSRLADSKQPGMLLDAYRRVRLRHRCSLLLVGSGPLEQQLKARVESENIPDVYFTGFLNHSAVTNAYAAADIFALLSAWGETFGIAVAEAMHFGLALVLSDRVGSAADLLGDGGNGFLVPHSDLDAVTCALDRLVANDDLRQRFGAASSDRIARHGLDQALVGALAAVRFAAERARARRSL
jgi:glycosyltransferase involved in cell wall biosynthesis